MRTRWVSFQGISHFRYAIFHQLLMTRMTFTCYKVKVLLLVNSKMQYSINLILTCLKKIITMFKACLTFDSCFNDDIYILHGIKIQIFDQFWINVHKGRYYFLCASLSSFGRFDFILFFWISFKNTIVLF